MSKYCVSRVDGKDNTDEKYVVIRVDLGAKLVHKNRKIVNKFIKMLKNNDSGAAREIKAFMKDIEKFELRCPSCNGTGDFEISAGLSHSSFSKCDQCKGKGLIDGPAT
jgi:DnaJ-class molecular chaperone